MAAFEYNENHGRVLFGCGTLEKLFDEVTRLKASAPLLLSTAEQVGQVFELQKVLNYKVAGIFTKATMHTPIHITAQAVEYALKMHADCIISIGGGSTTGLGKAISIRTGLPHICIPTTYAGSEMTPILGETASNMKTIRTDPAVIPRTVIYDPNLTMTLPTSLSVSSGLNAMAHASKSLNGFA
jgi:alcohol dehydrogenase class IV